MENMFVAAATIKKQNMN